MGSTNFTPNYSLPQFIGTDKPAWLTDVNGAFSNIDTAIKNAADAASNASSVAGSASSAATAAANTANTLDTQINTPSTGLAAVVSQHTTDITNIDTKLGNATLTTTSPTVTGAINELDAEIGSTPLDTTATTLTAAINEVNGKIDNPTSVSVTPEGGDTWAALIGRLYAACDTTKITARSKMLIHNTGGQNNVLSLQTAGTGFAYTRILTTSSNMLNQSVNLSAATYYEVNITTSTTTFNNATNNTVSGVDSVELVY